VFFSLTKSSDERVGGVSLIFGRKEGISPLNSDLLRTMPVSPLTRNCDSDSLGVSYCVGVNVVRGRLHVSDSAYELPYDSVHNLHTNGLGFRVSFGYQLHPLASLQACKHISGKNNRKLNCKLPCAGNRTQNRTEIRTQNRMCRRAPKRGLADSMDGWVQSAKQAGDRSLRGAT
jgi:hypothetical protein